MFTDITDNQYVADRIKAYVLAAETSKSTQLLILRTIKEFEKLPWIPLALEDAHKAVAPSLMIDQKLMITYDGSVDDALLAIDAMLRKYAVLINPTAITAPKEYTADEAAAFVGISRAQFDTYASRKKVITGRKVGTSILYSEDDLEQLKASRKPAGRPEGSKNKPKAGV
jgi:hypothetical protein